MALTEIEVKKTKAKDKPQKLTDGGGLFLLIQPNGGKYWRLAYRFAQKQKVLAFGVYPEISLAQARERREGARKLLAQGIDPSEYKKAQAAQAEALANNSFAAICYAWLDKKRQEVAPAQYLKAKSRMENDVLPWLGKALIHEVTPVMILDTMKRTDARGARYTAHKLRAEIGQVFKHAIQHGQASYNPCPDLIGAIPSPKVKHFAAFTEPKDVAEFMRAIEGFKGTFVVQAALRLAPLFFCRPSELRKAEWSGFDFEAAEWRYTVSKTGVNHIVPLSTQALAILKELHPLTGGGRYLFTGARDRNKCMSDAAINAALRRMGYDTQKEITGHGMRAMARTMLAERLNQKPEVIEHQLSHSVPDALGNAYNRTKYLDDRRELMQIWSDYLDKLKAGAEVVKLRA